MPRPKKRDRSATDRRLLSAGDAERLFAALVRETTLSAVEQVELDRVARIVELLMEPTGTISRPLLRAHDSKLSARLKSVRGKVKVAGELSQIESEIHEAVNRASKPRMAGTKVHDRPPNR